ncbi:hypothetical protein O9H85_33590 [Paenibacillus filicis]|uniref:Protein kinase domain-containing protein n=1 Tax=Paenibacillus gyeongsangnamensis TaxID=3388067 RepID=A0ABT4QJZ0_9BACL|nr:hypothetical protein [Paenibacillus filicis]MCZ8517198.1 hypothetical protein [Paenibacillus filicis]
MRKSIRKLIKGKQVFGEGASRIVYDLGNGYVLKVAKSKKAIKYNKREIRIYKSVPSTIKKHLAEIIHYGRSWLIMKKYDRKFPKSRQYVSKLNTLKSKFRKNGITPFDITRDNLRLNTSGKIKVIDYGNFKLHNRRRG